MRQVVLDTETTGLETKEGHRIIEIGALEILDRQLSGRQLHLYLNPQRAIDAGALEVHGITSEFLEDKPIFSAVAGEFLDFIENSELIIHNAPFDVGFLDHELALADPELGTVTDRAKILDTLELARELHPGQRNNLDALCKRYLIDNSNRTVHGALLDAQLLAEVYLAMTGGQSSLGLELAVEHAPSDMSQWADASSSAPLTVVRARPEELEAHNQRLTHIEKVTHGQCLWLHADEAEEPAPSS